MVKIVIGFWFILLVIILVQIYFIVQYIRNGVYMHISNDNAYSQETLEKTRLVIDAIQNSEIKKHIITNSAPKYDSPKTRMQYKNFLMSELMKDILELSEERYCG